MKFTKKQISEIAYKYVQRENGLPDLGGDQRPHPRQNHRKYAVACEAFYVALAVPSWATLAMDHKPFYRKPHNIFVDKTLLPE